MFRKDYFLLAHTVEDLSPLMQGATSGFADEQ